MTDRYAVIDHPVARGKSPQAAVALPLWRGARPEETAPPALRELQAAGGQ